MLLWLAQHFEAQLHILGVVQYLTLRAILGVLTALGISLLAGPWFIRTMESKQMGQIRSYRRAQKPPKQIRYAHHGRHAYLICHMCQFVVVGRPHQPFCVGAAFYTGGLWSGGLGGRLP